MTKHYTFKEKLLKNIQIKLQRNIERKKTLAMFRFADNVDLLSVYGNCRMWILNNTIENKGIKAKSDSIDSCKNTPYPEVSGYYIPTLLDWGYKDLAKQYAKWLVSIQHENGAWYDWLDKDPYAFDTGQILKGLIAIYPIMPEVKENIIKGCDWIISLIEEDGRLQSPSLDFWQSLNIPELIHLYCLTPLIEASRLFNKPEYNEQAKKVLNYYKKTAMDKILDFHTLSHFYGYIMEALVDLGEIDIAKAGMEQIAKLQRKNGMIPAYKNVKWTCSTGLFQFALVWYKLGEKQKADLTFDYACTLQTKNGGWLGSYGKNCKYLQEAEISWANKYFLDALKYKISTHFAMTANKNVIEGNGTYPLSDYLPETDGRVQFILKELDTDNMLDVGCGLGRILKIIQAKHPQMNIFATDVSQVILNKLPDKITSKVGSLLNIPYEDNRFDFVMTTEALEHAVDIENAIKELARVTAKGGKLLIIDKNINAKGAFQTPPWEQWFDVEKLAKMIKQEGFEVNVYNNLPHNDKDGSDGIYTAWVGRKL